METSAATQPEPHFQRRFLRRRVDVRVRISSDTGAQDVLHGRCTVIGEGGFGAILSGELPDSGYYWAEFRSSLLEDELRVRVNVRQKKGFQYGFQFSSLTRDQRSLVMKIFAHGLG